MPDRLITIGITCYREGEWLRECWESVLAQTDDRWEAVIVLDGGADAATRKIFDGLDHPRLRKHAFPENVGSYPARNKAFELTRTPYHFYLDGDDQLVPESVALVLAAFAGHPGAGFVYGDYQSFGESASLIRFPPHYLADDLARPGGCLPGACAYRKDIWVELGGFAPELARGNADHDFHIAMCERGYAGLHCGSPFYRYRRRGDSISCSYGLRFHETHEAMVLRHPAFFADPARRRRFLGQAYALAAAANYAACDFPQARRLGALAARHGCYEQVHAILWRARLAECAAKVGCGTLIYGILRRIRRPAWLNRRRRGCGCQRVV